jgi:1,4-alpha-glucan branching enzyme
MAKSDGAAASPIGDVDLHLFNEGTHAKLYEKLGAQVREGGTHFAVWAPNAELVTVIGDFNGWDKDATPLVARGGSGIWEGFVPGVGVGEVYKFHVRSRQAGYRVDKADPFAFFGEVAPRTGSIVWRDDHRWGDARWMANRAARNALDAPIAIYEMHLGSWRRVPEEGFRSLGYREIAAPLIEHVKQHGFTHVELLPLMEHPFFGSWGYQVTGYFAPTSRFGTPADLKYLVDALHQAGIGVILDWVPSHFPGDEHGLAFFDGTHLYEHADRRQGHHPDWDSYIFNYGRKEVRSFLLSSAHYWLDRFHADGLRVDGVASMLYLDYSRKEGEWIPNRYGGRENLDAMEFLRALNTTLYGAFPGTQTYAEESTSWPMVSRPVELGGLGFGLKWDMGWMHDTLEYFRLDPIHRKYHHQRLTFRGLYQNHENFVLPLSHDEVVHGKGSLIGKTSGDDWQRRANLRLLFGYMTGVTGKKLLFMGAELGQWREWNHDGSLDWHLVDDPAHAGIGRCLGDLNRLYTSEPALHQRDCDPRGFHWIDCNDALQSTLGFLRLGKRPHDIVLVACNFTPVVRERYRLGVPRPGSWRELVNTDATDYGGSGVGNLGAVESTPSPMHGHPQSIELTLPPLAAVFFKPG